MSLRKLGISLHHIRAIGESDIAAAVAVLLPRRGEVSRTCEGNNSVYGIVASAARLGRVSLIVKARRRSKEDLSIKYGETIELMLVHGANINKGSFPFVSKNVGFCELNHVSTG